jgi:hypothetical protein
VYGDTEDLRAIQTLVQRTWSKHSHAHVGDLAWQRGAHTSGRTDWPTMLWDYDGSVVAWGWLHLPNALDFVVDPALPDLADAVLTWAEDAAQSDRLSATVLETEIHLIDALERRGFQAVGGPFSEYMARALGDLADPMLPPGFTARTFVPYDDFERRVRVHRRAWSLLPFAAGDREATSGLTLAAFRGIISTWPYRADLDWVVEGPDGEFAASCCAWLDDTNGVVELESVGTDPRFRGLGLPRRGEASLASALASGKRTHGGTGGQPPHRK